MKRLLYRILRKDMIRRLKVKHGEQFIEDVMQTFDLSFDWRKMNYPPPPPPANMRASSELPEPPEPEITPFPDSHMVVNIDGQIYMASINDITMWPKVTSKMHKPPKDKIERYPPNG